MDEAANHAAPVREKGRWYEDFEPGESIVHHWGRTLTAADNALFCTATLNFLPRYLDDAYARSEGSDGVILHPLLVLGTAFGLSVEDLSEGGKGGPFLGVTRVQFHRDVAPDTTVRASSTVLEKRTSASRPGFGIVAWHTVGSDDGGEPLIEFDRTNLVRRRNK